MEGSRLELLIDYYLLVSIGAEWVLRIRVLYWWLISQPSIELASILLQDRTWRGRIRHEIVHLWTLHSLSLNLCDLVIIVSLETLMYLVKSLQMGCAHEGSLTARPLLWLIHLLFYPLSIPLKDLLNRSEFALLSLLLSIFIIWHIALLIFALYLEALILKFIMFH